MVQPTSFLLILLAVLSQPFVAAGEGISKSDQKAFDALIKAVERNGGYVHPSIGLVAPAPTSGAPRGIAIVKKIKKKPQDDVVIKVPLGYQMTRETALNTLSAIIPPAVLIDLPIEEFDDAALLVLLLVHEYGLGKKSKFYAYLQTLPVPIENGAGCGWANVEDFRTIPPGVDIDDIEAALSYAHRVSNGMNKDYGQYLAKSAWPKEWKEDPSAAIRWGLCVVSSRATAATAAPSSLTAATGAGSGVRLVPLADFANHQVVSGGFIELTGKERLANGDFMDAKDDKNKSDAGAFVVRSIWKCGTSKDLLEGDEITVNYNLPDYSAADWFLSLGFVPKELAPKQGHASEL